MTLTERDLERENAELRARLAEAEETLKAIREGQVDAVVVHGSVGPRVYSLSGAETVYRRIVETMGEAALSVSTEGRILFCNEHFSEFVGIPPEDLLGRDLARLAVPGDRETLRGLLRDCATGRIKGRVEFCGSDGVPRPALLLGNALTEDGACTLCLVAADLTELENSTKIQDELRLSEEQLREGRARLVAAMEVADVGTWWIDLVSGLDTRDARLNRLLGLEAVRRRRPPRTTSVASTSTIGTPARLLGSNSWPAARTTW